MKVLHLKREIHIPDEQGKGHIRDTSEHIRVSTRDRVSIWPIVLSVGSVTVMQVSDKTKHTIIAVIVHTGIEALRTTPRAMI